MLAKALPHRAQLLEPFLRVVPFALQHHERARELVRHFQASAFQLFLTPAQLLQLAFLFFDLFLLPFQLEQLLLSFLHLLVEMLGRQRFFLTQLQHLFDRSDFLWHDGISCACCRHISKSSGDFHTVFQKGV